MTAIGHPASDNELQDLMGPAVRERYGDSVRTVRLDRRLSAYRSSFAIEDLELHLNDGQRMPVIFKNLSPRALLHEAIHTRPSFLYEPLREVAVYRTVLSTLRLGTAACYAAHIDPQRDRYWLLLEKVPGVELYQVGELSVWQDVARWLARFHALAEDLVPRASEMPLLHWDRAGYQRAIERARECVHRRHRAPSHAADAVAEVARGYARVMDHLAALPVTVTHGDFFASNILIQRDGNRTRVCPIDWELAAIGPGLVDLAALVAGNWRDEQRDAMVTAYWHARSDQRDGWPMTLADLRKDLLCCRLHLAVQLLGRSPEWEPPQEHRRDWLAEAQQMVVLLGV